MVHLFSDRTMLDHVPPPRHPEKPERLAAILRHLDRTGLTKSCVEGGVRAATAEELGRVHDPSLLEAIHQFGRSGGGLIEADTWVSEGSLTAALLGAGAVVEAVDAVVEGRASRALCLVRPPGHHARPAAPMGFCLFNNIAVGAAEAIQRFGLQRVLIVDWDVHHGNGTQEIFYNDPAAAFFSIHRSPFYPGTGNRDETGTGAGLGTTRNLPLAYGIRRQAFLEAFRTSVEEFADRIRPELILISAGFDAHAEDPVGDLGLEVEDFVEMTAIVTRIAETHAGGRLVSILEGGYNVSILAGCVAEHLKALNSHSGRP